MLALVLAFQKIQVCLKNEEIKEDKTIHLMPVVYVINVRHDENIVFSILKPSDCPEKLHFPASKLKLLEQHPCRFSSGDVEEDEKHGEAGEQGAAETQQDAVQERQGDIQRPLLVLRDRSPLHNQIQVTPRQIPR